MCLNSGMSPFKSGIIPTKTQQVLPETGEKIIASGLQLQRECYISVARCGT